MKGTDTISGICARVATIPSLTARSSRFSMTEIWTRAWSDCGSRGTCAPAEGVGACALATAAASTATGANRTAERIVEHLTVVTSWRGYSPTLQVHLRSVRD